MRILQIVTLVTPDGAYGGPARVAVNQARALRAIGHDVTIAGGYRGFPMPPTELDGVPARLFAAHFALPRLGFAGLWSPGLHRWVRRTQSGFDIVHVHMGRDLVSLPAAFLVRGSGRLVVQTHGMIDPSTNPLARPLDAALTRRVLRRTRAILFLTEDERQSLIAVGAPAKDLLHLPNGVPPASTPTLAGSREVLFLGRLHKRKHPLAFAAAARSLAEEYPDWTFALIGPDEGEARAVREAISSSPRIAYEGSVPPDSSIHRMARSAVYVLPSVDEPFPMTVLEAMSLGIPVLVTRSCGLAPAIDRAGAGLVVDPDQAALESGMRALLSATVSDRAMLGGRGRDLVRRQFSMESVAERLEQIYTCHVEATRV